ncbi:RimK family alpha-L-glutamate ligase [Marinomonas piezotolerans]|uniref:RimK family alpha-L-glutamate ligase n=1 Tax=Marinomonas piezotolerans TaxID=2213058 RepID=A0A370U5T4_9GAMM|nr:RimK family protein [Marinomonas piezotolerans]RDL43131.1 RimK family alpha-L-glutamate ligase [Marinomonas piezotolerans]
MAQTYIIVDHLKDWTAFSPSDRVITFPQYLTLTTKPNDRTRIINLCKSSRYLSDGYYCSLLAESRGHNVMPSVRVLNDLNKKALYDIELSQWLPLLAEKLGKPDEPKVIKGHSVFGNTLVPELKEFSRKLFEKFPCPVIEFTLSYKKQWQVKALKATSHSNLNDEEETLFADALDQFSNKVWQRARKSRSIKFDLAMLVNPDEAMPPSDTQALKKFVQAGKQLGIQVDQIGPKDIVRLAEYDGLFIRETTNIDHHTYQFAKKAEASGLVVMDDPQSIMRCTNKVYLADLFNTHKVPCPKTRIIHKGELDMIANLEHAISYPMVVKIPDGAFSKGVEKAKNRVELEACLATLFKKSSLLLVQEYLYTEFDWRIGILNNKPIYACRYYMVKDHWQIYQHAESTSESGGFDTLPTFEVPRSVLQAAIAATKPIGNGLYGVDVKEHKGRGYVIEVNDNPSIDRGVEDKYLGDELYMQIMGEFLRRMQQKRIH